jgi:hypothetical protein
MFKFSVRFRYALIYGFVILTMRQFTVLLLMAFISCRLPSTFTSEEKQAVTDSVRTTLTRYYEDIKREGLLAEFKYLDSSADFHWLPPGYAQPITYDSVANFIRAAAPLYKAIDIKWNRLDIGPVSSDTASYEGELRSSMTDTSGKTNAVTLTEKGRVIKRKDGWKLLDGETRIASSLPEK